MKSLNRVTLIGNVTHDPEGQKTSSAKTVCTFDIATNREWKNAKGEPQTLAEYHHIVAWGKQGEFCSEYIKKGAPLYVEGHLKTSTWENKQQVKMHRTEIILERIILLGSKGKSATVEPESSGEEEE